MPETRHDQMMKAVRKFHKENPEVYRLFEKKTLELIAQGFEHHSAKAIFEHLRWETAESDTEGKNVFKLPNNHHAFYSRQFMHRHPEYAGFFRTRKQISRHKPPRDRELTPEDYETFPKGARRIAPPP